MKLSSGEEVRPFPRVVGAEDAEICFDLLIGSFSLSICLWVICGGVTRVDRLATRSRVLTLREVLTKRHSVLKVKFKCWNKRRESNVTTRRVVDSQD